MKTALRTSLLIFLATVLALTLAGCKAPASPGTTYEVSAGLREFYRSLGGEDAFGPAISQPFDYENNECQYMVNALFCLDPSGTGTNRYRLYPLGLALGMREEPNADEPTTSSMVVNGFSIYEEFIPFYSDLSGVVYAGNPITQARMNYAQQRIEQYFENVGFYRNFSDPAGKVQLLAYGAASCADRCTWQPAVDAVIHTSSTLEVDRVFSAGLEKIGDATIFGTPLTQAYLAADGMQEQVYQNAVIFAAPGSSTIQLRPAAVILEMPAAPPGPKVYSNKEGMVFYTIEGVLGYHVPILFDDFINAHGGMRISGNPITEVSESSPGVYRQCFENYCLEYIPANTASQQILLTALGSLYLDKMRASNALEEAFVISPSTVAIRVSEEFKQISAGQSQRISILLTRQSDGEPISGLESVLQISLPDGSVYENALPATSGEGKASILIPALKGIPNGSILPYRVCLTGSVSQPVCAGGTFLFWTKP
jgi:hypothetical protein